MAFETMEKYRRTLRQLQIQVNCALFSNSIVTSDPLQKAGFFHKKSDLKAEFLHNKAINYEVMSPLLYGATIIWSSITRHSLSLSFDLIQCLELIYSRESALWSSMQSFIVSI